MGDDMNRLTKRLSSTPDDDRDTELGTTLRQAANLAATAAAGRRLDLATLATRHRDRRPGHQAPAFRRWRLPFIAAAAAACLVVGGLSLQARSADRLLYQTSLDFAAGLLPERSGWLEEVLTPAAPGSTPADPTLDFIVDLWGGGI
jgi:hypothetical protein